MRIHGHRAVAIICALALSATVAAADDAWPVNVQRRAHAEDAFDVHMTFEQTQKEQTGPATQFAEIIPGGAGAPAMTVPSAASLPSPPPASSTAPAAAAETQPGTIRTLKADLTCHVEVQDVNYRGQMLLQITIGKFVSLPDGQELVPAGKIIALQMAGIDASFAMQGGGEISDAARTVLGQVYPLSCRLDDVSYGSVTPRKAGETWEVDGASVAQMDSNVQTTIDKASVKGKVTLAGLERNGSAQGLRVKIDVSHAGADRMRRLGNEIFTREDVTTQMSILLPLDPALPPLETQVTSDIHATGDRRTQAGGNVTKTSLVQDTHRVVKQTITPVKSGPK